MKRVFFAMTTSVMLLTLQSSAGAVLATATKEGASIGNHFLERQFSTRHGRFVTSLVNNKRADTKAVPLQCNEFVLRLSQGTEKTDTDIWLTTADFVIQDIATYKPDALPDGAGLSARLYCAAHDLTVTLCYELAPDDFYLRKFLQITPAKGLVLERVEVESLCFSDALQPYKLNALNARGKWSPGLGQPLYTSTSATFWGIEFPAADNQVTGLQLACGYLYGRRLNPGTLYTSYKAVMGVADSADFIQDAFFDYINRIRIRPLRLQVQYNSWFDFGSGVNRQKFIEAMGRVNAELVEKRGCQPLNAYVIDDGWQDVGPKSDWTDKTWKINSKFDPDFKSSIAAATQAGSSLGLWLSPGCNFGARPMVPRYREAGFEALENYMSLAGPQYMHLLEERLTEMTKSKIAFFKFDGLFGHLNTREFELHGGKYGLPEMPQLGVKDLTPSDPKLNDAKFNELKTYYMVAGTERLIQIFHSMAGANPDVYIVISNGAYLSPWWLMHIDSVWMIMAGDAASGATRTDELVYRDNVYYEITTTEKTQFPICSIFNHEPKKTATGESKEIFRDYLYMNMSRGTGFIELYLKSNILQAHDWDVLAEGIQWAKEVFPTFSRARMHGGNPANYEVYGYTAWNANQGYVSIHNPSWQPASYTLTLDRAFGLLPHSGKFYLSSPMEKSTRNLAGRYSYGERIKLKLEPGEIRILNFDKTKRDWSKLKALQTRTPYVGPPPPKPLDKNHPVLGVWHYLFGGQEYTREFTIDRRCILRNNGNIIWIKRFSVVDSGEIMVENLKHVVKSDGTMDVEGQYNAVKAK